MSPHTKLILLTLVCSFLNLSLAENKCEECMADNEAYCVDKTSYYLCMNDKPLKSTLSNCPEDHVCTNSANICEPESVANKPICDSSCNKCPTNGRYTCVSKTQFGRCIGNEVAIVSSCESGSICSIDMLEKAGQICAPTCVVDFFGFSATCRNDKPITTTVAPPTTPNVSNLEQKCKDNVQNKKIYYVINDSECKTYIYCEKVGDDVVALLMKCSNGFYDVNLNKCVAQKPEECGANSNSPVESTTVTVESTTIPLESTTIPVESSTIPVETTTVPVESSTVPVESTTIPVESSTIPVVSTTVTVESTTIPVESTTIPIETTTVPVESTTIPVESTTISVESTTIPVESTTITVESSTIPVVSTTVTVESTTIPVESSTIPVESTTVPVVSTTVPVESTTIPLESTTIPVESSTISVESTTIPVESTTIPVESTNK